MQGGRNAVDGIDSCQHGGRAGSADGEIIACIDDAGGGSDADIAVEVLIETQAQQTRRRGRCGGGHRRDDVGLVQDVRVGCDAGRHGYQNVLVVGGDRLDTVKKGVNVAGDDGDGLGGDGGVGGGPRDGVSRGLAQIEDGGAGKGEIGGGRVEKGVVFGNEIRLADDGVEDRSAGATVTWK